MRARSFDLIRGFIIFLMLITHGVSFWAVPSSAWLNAFVMLSIASFGTCGFVFISGASVGFSWAQNERSGIPQKDQYLKGLASAIALLVLSYSYNALSSTINAEGFQALFYWHLFLCLAYSRLLGLLFVRVKKFQGIILVGIIIAFAAIFMQAIDYGVTTDPLKFILYSIFYRRLDDYPIFVYFPFFLMGMLIGKEIQVFVQKPTSHPRMLKNWFYLGIIFMIAGVLLGSQLSTLKLGWPLLEWLSTYPFASITSLPFFTILDTYAWCVFFIGFHICFLLVLFYYLDLRPLKQPPIKAPKKGMLDIFGKYSLTVYMAHMVLYAFPLYLDYIHIWGIIAVYVLLMWLWFYYMDKFGKGKIALEYVMSLFAAWLFQKFVSKREAEK